MEYAPGDPLLIKNIVTQLKSQGIFDQIRKECIVDVDTKPAYQNLCHRADTQVSKFLSKVKWGPDLHKNQTRENIRRQVNECSFVEPGIAIIVDQLVNPRINTVLVPKVEDMLYRYLGIPREVDTSTSHRETKLFDDKSCLRDVPDHGAPGISRVEINDRKRDAESRYTDGSQDPCRMEYKKYKHDAVSGRNDSSTNKIQSSGDRYSRDRSSYIKTEFSDSNYKDADKLIKMEPEGHYSRIDSKITPIPEFDSESSDDEISPPFEPNEKSDNDMSIGSSDSNFSEIIDIKISSEPDIPGVDPEPNIICKVDDPKIIIEQEESLDSIRSVDSSPPVPEKVHISPLEIPKTPTINYETSDDSDDYIKNKKLETIAVNATESLEVPEVNFDKIVEKVIEDNTESKPLEAAEIKTFKEEDKYKNKNRSEDTKKKDKPKCKDDKPIKSGESKEKHVDKKSEHRSDKDRKYDKHRSEHKSKDREKDKSKNDSLKGHSRKDDKSHHSRDHSKSDHDRKSKTDYRKDDYKKDDKPDHRKDSGRSEHKKDDRSEHKKDDKTEHRKDSRTDRKKEDDRKHSKDDKDRKKDHHKVVSSSDDKKSSKTTKTEDSKLKFEKYDKPRDDKKSTKPSDSNKAKKKEEDQKKSRSHCNMDEKKKTDRRSSDRDSSGPSTSNSSSIHHASSQHSNKSEKDKGSKHKHSSSSSSSHKTKRNDTEHEKNHTEKQPNDHEKNPAVEDDLEMILESSPDKGFPNDIKSGANFSARKIFPDKSNEQSNDYIENMMNEMFQPTKPILKKPKIAKNFADIRRIMKLRKLYEEDVKLKSCEPNTDEFAPDGDKSTLYKIKLRKTVDYFVMKRFGKNGNNLEKCEDLTNAIIDTLTDVKLNITRVDRQYSLIDGSCMLSDDENGLIYNNNIDNSKMDCTKTFNEEMDDIPIIKDERANLILEDLANSYTDPNFKLGYVPNECKVEQPIVAVTLLEEDTIKIVQSEIKANGAKAKLPKQLTHAKNTDEVVEDETSPTLKLKIKSISDGEIRTWQACDQLEQIEGPIRYFPTPNFNNNFMQFANQLLNEEYDFEMKNLTVKMDYPECYDFIFTEFLAAKVYRRKSDDPKTSPIKYNSEIIRNKKLGDKSIMLRIKKTSESEESADRKILNKKRKLADDSGVELDANESSKEEPVKKKKKTLGIKRTFANPLKMKLTSGQLSDTIGNNLIENNVDAKTKTIPVHKKITKVNKSKKIVVSSDQLNDTASYDLTGSTVIKTKNTPVSKKVKVNKSKEITIANAKYKKSESESTDGQRYSVSPIGTSTHSKVSNESVISVSASAPTTTQTKNKTKNTMLNDSKTDTIETNINESVATTKMPDPPVKKANDTKNAEEKRKQSIMNCYYDESDLYKPRPSLRLTSRRYRLGNTENT